MRFPGHAVPTGARIPAETGDDRTRFNAARDLKAYAGSAPVTRESSKSRRVRHHQVKNSRSAATGRHWAFAALTARCPRPPPQPSTGRRRPLLRGPPPPVQPHARSAPPEPDLPSEI
ncbi:transposase [Streptomyces sp. NBC_00401]|nr:transposase [Streptomyces sp. NBC_00401]MCX5081552.1 transposase [Streptomyces sp. NBC_00401]